MIDDEILALAESATFVRAEATMIVARDYGQSVFLEPRQCGAVLAEIDRLKAMIVGLTDRVARQSELLSRRAEKELT